MSASRCKRHDLAAGPDGRCVVCRRELEAGEAARVRKDDRPVRLVAKVIVGLVAGVATFFLLLSIFDTAPEQPTRPAADAQADALREGLR